MVHNTIPKQIWFVVAMVAALLALALAVGLGWSPGGRSAAVGGLQPTTPPHTPLPQADGAETPAPSPTPAQTAAPAAAVRTATAAPTPTFRTIIQRPTPSPYVGLPQRDDHYWLARPIAADGTDIVGRFYPYGSRQDGSYPVHHGVEFVNPLGTPVLAVADGKVVVAGGDQTTVYGARDDFYGTLIVIALDRTFENEPLYALYGHLSAVHVRVGQRVEAGQTIGLVGMAGVAEGPHLHFEVRLGANDYESTVNPELWLTPKPGNGTLAGVLLDNNGVLVDDEARLIIQSASGAARYEVTTYPTLGVNPDPGWLEDFCIGDLAAGTWHVQTFIRGQLLEEAVTIVAGQTTWLQLQLTQ